MRAPPCPRFSWWTTRILKMLVGHPPIELLEDLVAGIAYLPSGRFEALDEVGPDDWLVEAGLHIVLCPGGALIVGLVPPAVNSQLHPAGERLAPCWCAKAGDGEKSRPKIGAHLLELSEPVQRVMSVVGVIPVEGHR